MLICLYDTNICCFVLVHYVTDSFLGENYELHFTNTFLIYIKLLWIQLGRLEKRPPWKHGMTLQIYYQRKNVMLVSRWCDLHRIDMTADAGGSLHWYARMCYIIQCDNVYMLCLVGIHGTVVIALDCKPIGRAVDYAPGSWFITKFISFAQVVASIGLYYSAESWPKKHQSFRLLCLLHFYCVQICLLWIRI